MSLNRITFLRLSATAAALALFAGCATQTMVAPVDPALLDPAKNSAIKPEPRDANWVKRHDGFVEIAKKGGVNILFVGDSITDAWRNPDPAKGGKMVWDREYAPLGAANFGISGDRTQHVLWRLQNGELQGISPKLIVMMIGTNNTGFERDGTTRRNTPAETVQGVTAIVKELRTKLPATKLLLLAVFPRAEKPDHPQRAQIAEINREIAKLADGKNVRYLDIGQKFLNADGSMSKDIMPDFLHPGQKGYEIWAAAIKAPVAEMMK